MLKGLVKEKLKEKFVRPTTSLLGCLAIGQTF
jgi:hypothetical protein